MYYWVAKYMFGEFGFADGSPDELVLSDNMLMSLYHSDHFVLVH